MFSASRKGPAFKPQLRVCYLCGQQFGSASIGIHIPQCYEKKVAQWKIADPATRGKRPKHPDTVNWKGDGTLSNSKLNDEQFREFTENLVPCRECGRKFLPDRLVVHLRSCKGNSGRITSRSGGASSAGRVGGGESEGVVSRSSVYSPNSMQRTTRSPRKSRDASITRTPGYKPQLPICYLCGQQFGTSSIAIHVPQCYAKKLAQWEAADVHTRGKPPKHPDTVNWRGNEENTEEHNDIQFAEFVSNLEPCPNCGRKFLADRLVVHLRSCKPGSTAKPPPHPPRTGESRSSATRLGEGNSVVRAAGSSETSELTETKSGDPERASTAGNSRRLDPKVRRLPKDGKVVPDGRTCPRCSIVEYDASAKYCRECGTNFTSKNLPTPCIKCGEQIPEGSRFCGTCGVPINGAAANERTAGAENINAPTIRVVVCPACKAVCDADGNFCDNCGAALGDVEPSSTSAETLKEVMYCEKCCEYIEELTANFCEECGGPLEKMNISAIPGEPPENPSTLPPIQVDELHTVSKTAPTIPKKVSLVSSMPTPSRESCDKEEESISDSKPKSANSLEKENKISSIGKKPSPPKYTSPPKDVEDYEDVAIDVGPRVECSNCGRKFAMEALERHERVCVTQKKRKVFNVRAMRLTGTGAENLQRTNSGVPSPKSVPKKNWRAESQAFRRAMREARMVDKVLKSGGNARDLPPPTYSENSHYIPCPHCGRKFAPDVAERHIPRCATTVNKPKPPPRRR
ncbi:Double zinc ribbon [Trypanosoma melophagium]|uniref:Double zinc ribbon n=1 Tax=Trypanosoma melophagium TaxID=715481 RepID=UPI003519F6FE|nr:Double zinc ribbon [Trypanosoma melophagium]